MFLIPKPILLLSFLSLSLSLLLFLSSLIGQMGSEAPSAAGGGEQLAGVSASPPSIHQLAGERRRCAD